MDAITKFLDSWDGQPMAVKQMIREVHKFQDVPHFKFQDLVEQLEKRGFAIEGDQIVSGFSLSNVTGVR